MGIPKDYRVTAEEEEEARTMARKHHPPEPSLEETFMPRIRELADKHRSTKEEMELCKLLYGYYEAESDAKFWKQVEDVLLEPRRHTLGRIQVGHKLAQCMYSYSYSSGYESLASYNLSVTALHVYLHSSEYLKDSGPISYIDNETALGMLAEQITKRREQQTSEAQRTLAEKIKSALTALESLTQDIDPTTAKEVGERLYDTGKDLVLLARKLRGEME